jgi:uncharacterized protein (DUF1330 family)
VALSLSPAAASRARAATPALHSGIGPTLEDAAVSAYVIFDVEIRDPARYQEFMNGVKPALEAAGARYLARGGAHKVYEGDWAPRRIVLIEFPSVAAWEAFYNGPVYQALKAFRDEVSSARLVSVEGLGP